MKEILRMYCWGGTGHTRYSAMLLEQLKWTWGTNTKKCTVGKSSVTLMNVVLWVLGNTLWWDAGCAPAHKVVNTAKSDDVRVWEPVQLGHRRRMDESQEQCKEWFMPSHLDIRHDKTVTSWFFLLGLIHYGHFSTTELHSLPIWTCFWASKQTKSTFSSSELQLWHIFYH